MHHSVIRGLIAAKQICTKERHREYVNAVREKWMKEDRYIYYMIENDVDGEVIYMEVFRDVKEKG